MEQQLPISSNETIDPQQRIISQNFVLTGVFIGVVISMGIIGGIYYKNKLNKVVIKTPQKQTNITPEPIATVSPITISTQQDLTTQQNELDSIDFSSVSSSLEQNEKDAALFSQ